MDNKYLIDVPPPTISGKLHIGHIYSYAQMDFYARYALLSGKELVYPFCYDNNGLPTEKLAEKHGVTDPETIKILSDGYSFMYSDLFTAMQMALTYDRYSTFESKAIQLAQKSFEDLVDKGLAYKAQTEFWFCPEMKISVSQSELDEEGRFERSGVKAILKKGEGWFIDINNHLPRIRGAIDKIIWHPEKFKHRLHRWLDELEYDWSISRDRSYGISIPGEDTMKFDTWFISSLTPQLAWMAHTGKVSLECPIFDARFQAHDIIRTWALYTIIKSLYHNNQIPWTDIYISGHALDPKDQKISKSKGNFISPYNHIEKYGAGGVRYWAAISGMLGNDTKIEISMMNSGKKLINKFKNAERYIRLQIESGKLSGNLDGGLMYKIDDLENRFHSLFSEDRFNDAIIILVDFFWHTICDQWIEKNKIDNVPTLSTIIYAIHRIRRLIAIFLPELQLGQEDEIKSKEL